MLTSLFNSLAILLSLSTATGVLVHDTKIDKAASSVLASPIAGATYEASAKSLDTHSELHTHVERSSIAQALHDVRSDSPRIQPRASEDKKHLLSKHVARGHHAFDNYSLPLV